MSSHRPKRRWNSPRYPRMVTVRVTAAEHKALMERASLARLSASRYLVAAGLSGKAPKLRETPPPSPEEALRWEQLLWGLHKLGTNVNQLARDVNRARLLGWSGPHPAEIERAARDVRLLLRLIRDRL